MSSSTSVWGVMRSAEWEVGPKPPSQPWTERHQIVKTPKSGSQSPTNLRQLPPLLLVSFVGVG